MTEEIKEEKKYQDELVFRDPKELKVAPTNVRMEPISEQDMNIMEASIRKIGVKTPIIINEKNEVVSGSIRWAAALAAGLDKVQCILRRFPSKFDERITCIVQDYHHHPLTDKERFMFVKKCVEEDGKTLDEIAEELGVSIWTVKQWAKWDEVPDVIKDNPKYRQAFLDTPRKKKLVLQGLLKKKPFKDDPELAMQMIDLAENLSLRELQSIRKDVTSGLYIDLDFRRKLVNMNTFLVEVKVPKTTDMFFRKKLRSERRDYVKTMIDLMEKYVKGEIEL